MAKCLFEYIYSRLNFFDTYYTNPQCPTTKKKKKKEEIINKLKKNKKLI